MIFLVLVSIPKLVKYLPPFHKSLVWDKTLLLVHDRNWIPPLLPQKVVFYYNFLMYNYVVLLFQLVLVRVFLTPGKLSSSLSITSYIAIYRCNTRGPTFGRGCGHDIYISEDSGNNQKSYTKCGCTYTTPSGYSNGNCGFFTGESNFSPTDVEVFYEAGN